MKGLRMTKPILLIDGDMLVYRALAGTEVETNWGDDIWTLHSNEREGWEKILHRLGVISEKLGVGPQGGSALVLCFTGANNFRKKLYPPYKGNRAHVRKPLGYKAMVERLMGPAVPGVILYKVLRHEGIEADDVMGILATKPGNEGRTIIVSDDKDMRSLPGKLWRENGDPEREVIEITEAEADRYHLLQTLVGDQSDNYPGCPGIGPKKAEGVLKGDNPWAAIVAAYTKAGLTEEDALVQARVARILRWSDWCHETKQPKLWSPS
jgi:DNA polymerase-1